MGSPLRTLSLTFYFLLLSVLSSSSEANLIGDVACKLVDCGQGICNSSAENKPPFYFECECYPGWTQFKISDQLTLPGCVVPNCTLNFDCGFPSLPPLALPANLSDACAFTYCGNGTCALGDGVGHQCICSDGAFNLLNMPNMPCFQECYLGSDCNSFGLSRPPPSSKQPSLPSPTSTSNAPGSMPARSGLGRVREWIESIVHLMFLLSLHLFI